jgi:hypothetical protein
MQATAPAISRAARGLLKPLPRTSERLEEPVRRVVDRIAFEGKLMGRELPQAEPAPTGA